MWTFRSIILNKENGFRFVVDFQSRPASYMKVVEAWKSEAEFRSQFNSVLLPCSPKVEPTDMRVFGPKKARRLNRWRRRRASGTAPKRS